MPEEKKAVSNSISIFETLNNIDVNDHTEKKGSLTYLSWAWAWRELKLNYPDAYYTIYENADGLNYHHDGRTAWVKTGVTVGGMEHIEYLPVMDYNNRSISIDKLTSFNVNTAIQRSLTKACARHGLGLYIYAGEDLPNGEKDEPEIEDKPITKEQVDFIMKELDETGSDVDRFLAYFKINSGKVENLMASQWPDVATALERKRTENEQKAKESEPDEPIEPVDMQSFFDAEPEHENYAKTDEPLKKK